VPRSLEDPSLGRESPLVDALGESLCYIWPWGAGSRTATGLPQQSYQLEHPSAEAIWKRAIEVFSSEELARKRMDTPLPILGQSTPQLYSSSGDVAKQREILTILGRIDYGMFS